MALAHQHEHRPTLWQDVSVVGLFFVIFAILAAMIPFVKMAIDQIFSFL